MPYLSVRGVLLMGAVMWMAGCTPMNGGVLPPLLAPKPASYYASSGLMLLRPYTVFRDQTGALSLQAETGKDLPWQAATRRVSGQACQYGLELPFGLFYNGNKYANFLALNAGWGDGGAGLALKKASAHLAAGEVLFDIRLDVNTVRILSVWREHCVVVHARVAPALDKAAETNTAQFENN